MKSMSIPPSHGGGGGGRKELRKWYLQLNLDKVLISFENGRENSNILPKLPPDPKSMATFSHALSWIRAFAVMRDSRLSVIEP